MANSRVHSILDAGCGDGRKTVILSYISNRGTVPSDVVLSFVTVDLLFLFEQWIFIFSSHKKHQTKDFKGTGNQNPV